MLSQTIFGWTTRALDVNVDRARLDIFGCLGATVGHVCLGVARLL